MTRVVYGYYMVRLTVLKPVLSFLYILPFVYSITSRDRLFFLSFCIRYIKYLFFDYRTLFVRRKAVRQKGHYLYLHKLMHYAIWIFTRYESFVRHLFTLSVNLQSIFIKKL